VQLKASRISTTLYATEYGSWFGVFSIVRKAVSNVTDFNIYRLIWDINILNHPLDLWYFYVHLEFADQMTHFLILEGVYLSHFIVCWIFFDMPY